MMNTNLFMAACMWIFLPIMYVTNRNNTVYKNGLLLSVTLPPQAVEDPEVQALCREFRRRLKITMLWLTVGLVPAVFLPWMSVSCLWSMVWMIAAMVVCFRTYGRGYQAIKDWKKRHGLCQGVRVAAELRPVQLPEPLNARWFVPPVVVSVLPAISCLVDPWDESWTMILGITAGMGLVMTLLSCVLYGAIFRQRKDLLDDNLALTEVLTRVRRYHWTRLWLLSAWLTAGYSLAVWCCRGSSPAYFIVTAVYSVLLLAASLVTEFAARRAQQRLTGDRTTPVLVDEDDCWIWGQFYYNPNNPCCLINERVGMGMSVNYARPAGKTVAVLVVLVLLSLPVLGIWLIVQEFSPVELTLTDTSLTASQVESEYRVDRQEIVEVYLLTELPVTRRIIGTEMPNLCKGTYTVEGYGRCTICLNPENPPFLMVQTGEQTYLFGGDQAAAVYAALQ